MAGMVEFRLTPPTSHDIWDHPTSFTAGETNHLDGPLPAEAARLFPRGTRCSIQFAREVYYQRLEYIMREQARLPEDVFNERFSRDEILYLRFDLALLMVHELGHGVQIAAHGKRPTEIFYKDSPLSEAGFELIAEIFGGLIERVKTRPKSEFGMTQWILTLREWPSKATRRHYESTGSAIAWRKFRDFDHLWQIPMSYIEHIFFREFWDRAHLGAHALHPQKIARWPFIYDDQIDNDRRMTYKEIEGKFGWRRARIWF